MITVNILICTINKGVVRILDNLPEPDELAADIIENLQSALESFQELMSQLKKND